MTTAAEIDLGPLPELRQTQAGGRTMAWREAGAGTPLVLLHGIGSGSASWRMQLNDPLPGFRLIAWDAPGYGGSDALSGDSPPATAYAAALADLLDALDVATAHVLGHSLGAIIAGAFARAHGDRVRALVLASPARGYGAAAPEVRAARLAARLDDLDRLGVAELAAQRAPRLLSPDASAEAVESVRRVMAQLRPDGYRQGARLLANGDLIADAARIAAPTLVLCGGADTVTPEEECRAVAAAMTGAKYVGLPGLGHICFVEDPAAFNAVVGEFLGAQP